ncbi:hypothetical protein KF728_17145 [Candidatus Obscuribacterales bacterium]|nr:hypothetical protein [Candidatus Obscuribacterales bacterium]
MRSTKTKLGVVLGLCFLANNSATANHDDKQTERIEDPTKANICVVGDGSVPTNATTNRSTSTVDIRSELANGIGKGLTGSDGVYETLKRKNDEVLKNGHRYGGFGDFELGLGKHKAQVLRAFDKRCLSKPSARLVYSVFYDENNYPVYKKISNIDSTLTDEFYCEQAIWEVVPSYSVQGPEIVFEFGSADIRTMFGEHPELLADKALREAEHVWSGAKVSSSAKLDFVMLHVIPDGLRSSILPTGTRSSHHNVVRLEVSKLADPRLSQFRKECREILVLPCGTNFIIERAKSLKKKYATFFLPEKEQASDRQRPAGHKTFNL